MTRNLDEFLKQAARRRQRQVPPPVKPPAAPPLEIIEAELVKHDVSGDDVAAHVAQHLDASEFARRASQLGDVVGQADEKVESHLQSVFDHQVGQLGGKEPLRDVHSTPQPRAKKKVDLAALLHSSRSLQQAIVLSEILNRPEYRW